MNGLKQLIITVDLESGIGMFHSIRVILKD